MGERILKSTHDGVLKIGAIELECHVLEDGRRVFSSAELLKAFHLDKDIDTQKNQPRILASFLERVLVNSYQDQDLSNRIRNPLRFSVPNKGGRPIKGYEADLLSDMCSAIVHAASDYRLDVNLRTAAKRSSILLKSFAKIGVVALIDEATGYQQVRDKDALQAILDKYLKAEFSAWAKRFPDEFYMEMFRLRGWQWKGMKVNRPSVVGNYTNDIVYNRLVPGILDELRRLNPPNLNGRRSVRYHQWLTDDIGHPALNQHIFAVMALMRISSDWAQFRRALTRAFPKIGEQTLLPFDEDEVSE